jgi:hypothetical protein
VRARVPVTPRRPRAGSLVLSLLVGLGAVVASPGAGSVQVGASAQAAPKGKGGKPGKRAARKARAAVEPAAAAPAAINNEPDARVDTREPAAAEASAPSPAASAGGARPSKPRVYTFGGLDLEGKLKTPQLLYFRSRMRQELDTSGPQKRSFLKELEKTADDKGL